MLIPGNRCFKVWESLSEDQQGTAIFEKNSEMTKKMTIREVSDQR